MRKVIIYFILLTTVFVSAQELNCNLVVNAQQTGNENVQVFKTLEKQLNEFINNTRWTDKSFALQERIDCSMIINIQNYDSDAFQASIQVQSVRPVHNSNYVSSVYNFNDRDFNFKYLEYQNLNFNPTHYKQARDIANYSQQGNVQGWAPPKGGDQTRRVLIDNVLSKTYQEYRTALYNYHRLGLDLMSSDTKEAKTKIANALLGFEALHKRRPNSFLVRTFFDAKSDEIADVFSAGPNVKITELVSVLNRVAPMHSKKWGTIKF